MGNEQSLADRCRNGDPDGWIVLVQTYHRKIYNMAYRFTRRFDLAEEMTQDVFLKIYQNLGSFRPESGTLQSWVMRVSRNLIIDSYRHDRWQKNLAGSDLLDVIELENSEKPTADEIVHHKERAKRLMDAVHALPEELTQVILLRDIEELTYLEIAGLLGIPEGTVKSRINRGRIELAGLLSRQ